ncbi:MAG TPA: hypothetical protein VF058_06055 [Actinomycetota bacterium]
MQDLESELRLLMRDRAERLTSPPPKRQRPGASKAPRRRIVVMAVGALLAVAGAGIAISQGVGPITIVPRSESFEVASGETEEGSWRLIFYLAEIETGSGEPPEKAWCLDLDRSWAQEPGARGPQEANVCTEGGDQATGVGPVARFPRFAGDDALVYGAVSPDIASLEVHDTKGRTRETVEIIPAPEESGTRMGLFATFVEDLGVRRVDVVAFDRDGRISEVERV